MLTQVAAYIAAHHDIGASGGDRVQSDCEREFFPPLRVSVDHRLARQRFRVRRPSAAFTDGNLNCVMLIETAMGA